MGACPICSRCLSGILGARKVHPAGHGKEVFGLFPGLLRSEYPVGETPQLSTTFINQFMKVRGDFPVDFRPLGWVHSSDKAWWGKMVGFVLAELEGLLDQVRLYQAVRAVQYGIPQSSHNFYGILEHYNPLTGTFFTPVGEMGLALHELYEASGLVMGDAPMKNMSLLLRSFISCGESALRYTRLTGKCCVTSTSAVK